MINTITGNNFLEILSNGYNSLCNNVKEVNDLNVFPVPDGDTGTNMKMTLENGINASKTAYSNELSVICDLFQKGVVLGARGNSGVILSQFLKGLCTEFVKYDEISIDEFLNAYAKGIDFAYKAVMKPVEGTMLTVLRESYEAINKKHETSPIRDFVSLFALLLKESMNSVNNTPNLLHVLKSAKVVDSGGMGIYYIFEGMYECMKGNVVSVTTTVQSPSQNYIDYTIFNVNSTFTFGYCTEVLLQLLTSKTHIEEFNIDEFKNELSKFGSSIVATLNNDKVKIHIHTFTPEKVFALCHIYGEFLNIKVENMDVQHDSDDESGIESENVIDDKEVLEHTKVATVAVSCDDKISDLFYEMGVSKIVHGGDTCNPSVNDFIDAYKKIDADIIVVFPNNSNVILTVKQTIDLYNDAKIVCINTTSYAECYSTLPLVDYECEDTDSMTEELNEVIKGITTFTVTKAAKDAVYDDTKICKDDYIMVEGKKLLGCAKEYVDMIIDVTSNFINENNSDVLTLFAGTSVTDEEIETIKNGIDKRVKWIDIYVVKTSYDLHTMLISLE